MRALVSGSTGFSGAFLVSALRARNIEVSAVSQRAEGAGLVRMDLTSSAAWAAAIRDARPTHVFHLSGVAHSPNYADLSAQNTAAAAALLDATRAPGTIPGAVLLVGSATEYGLVPEALLPVAESHLASPQIPYGATKYAQTQLGLDAIRRGQRVIVVRPSNLLGPGMPLFTALGNFARQLREIELGRRPASLSVGDLSAWRDFIDVRDAVETYIALAVSAFAGLVNVSSGEHVPMQSMLDQLIGEFGISVSVQQDPARFRAAEVSKFSASTARLREILGQRKLRPVSESLRDMVAHERSVTA